MSLYADIILPLAQPAYTFAVPDGMDVCEGEAVAVQFGRNKMYTGIVWRIHDRRPDFKTVKPISKKLYDRPLLNRLQMDMWEWTADYYMCSTGEVMRCALPSLIKPSADCEDEFAQTEFRPRTETFLAIADHLRDAEMLASTMDKLLRRAPKQYAAMLELASFRGTDGTNYGEVARRLLGADSAAISSLRKKGFITTAEHACDDIKGESAQFRLPLLSAAQQTTLDTIREQFRTKRTVLLHGITGSGKTEIYITLIAKTLARGEDVLMLVPEIALTSQLIERMGTIFGSRVTPYHSKLTDRQRTETYLRLCRSEGGEFVIGVRSSIFLPLKKIGLIVVDEEHDTSYKQAEPAPRYNARDCAVIIGGIYRAKVILGSATPSIESYTNSLAGKYGYALLEERYGGAQLPDIMVSDTIKAVKRGERHTHFNKILLDKMESVLSSGGQVMLFQNRRGFSPYVECRECGWTARCHDCNVSLTYHKNSSKLVCHYCGHTEPMPSRCPHCRITEVVPAGFGTEKVEEEIAKIFPAAKTVRIDRDVASSKRAFEEALRSFERGESNIMVGTQMITKGFDFAGVALVGILNADNMLNNPDFRATEKAFQTITQVAGRAGRRETKGEVVIQTSDPENPVINMITVGDYASAVRMMLDERRLFFYPPYSRLIAIELRHRDPSALRRAAERLGISLREKFGRRLLGPIAPPVDRVRGEYIVGLLLKIESGASSSKARRIVRETVDNASRDTLFKNVRIICNVDPQ